MAEPPPPLILCMENINGEEVSLKIEQHDTFQMFLEKSKLLLGFDIDLNSITGNQPVSLNENAYSFLLNAEQTLTNTSLNPPNYSLDNDPSGADDLVYILDDGTQIRASQIQFDNEDPLIDLTLEKIPFIKYADVIDEIDEVDYGDRTVKDINITSPVSHKNSPKCNFANTLPFKLVCSNASAFELKFTKYLEERSYTTLQTANKNKSPRTLINDNFKNLDNVSHDSYTREDILNMFKNSPVAPLPYDSQNCEKRRHVRKTDPSRIVYKNFNAKPLTDIDINGKHDCFVCGKIISNNEKLYIFDKEDQKLHRCEQKKYTQLKVICEMCLSENFVASPLKSPNQSLNNDEYLVIKNNQQYIFQKTTTISFKKNYKSKVINENVVEERSEFVKVEIGPDGEIITKPVDNDEKSDDVILIKDDKKESYSDVEIIEPEPEIDLDNIEEDENVKEFLGKYQCVNAAVKQLKCRFCDTVFQDYIGVMDHGEEHKHNLEDGVVFPCPLCDYGYANIKWLKGHIKVAHNNNKTEEVITKEEENDKPKSIVSSPVAKRTRSAIKKTEGDIGNGTQENQEIEEVQTNVSTDLTFTTEIKQECLDSDDSIWIVQTGDDEQLQNLLKVEEESGSIKNLKKHKCFKCSKIFPNAKTLTVHKCTKRGRKRKSLLKEDSILIVPSREDFIKRAQGRPRREESDNNDLLVVKTRKRRTRKTSDSQIVTCHNCNESFTSKVRLKFHMQFHDETNLQTSDGQYRCSECDGAKFLTETELFDHVHFQHDKQKRWQCPVKGCGKTFFLRATLTKHSRTHTDTRRYVCVTCGKRFLDKQTLDEHGVTHLEIKPFQCHICLKQLTRRSRLRMHLRAHEEELSPALVLVCAICERAFRDHTDAQEHANKSVECIEEFTKEFKEETEVTQLLSPTSGIIRNSLKIVEFPRLTHGIERQVNNEESEALLAPLDDIAKNIIRVVNIEKAFRCEYCEDVFYLEEALNNHRHIHKGIKNPFTCHICKVSFATYSRCTTHKTTHGFYKRITTETRKEGTSGPASSGILGYGGFPVVKHFLCEDCGRSYLHWTYLQVHRRMKHANEHYVFKCNQCEMTFPNSWSVTYHRKKIHKKTGQDGGFTKVIRENYRIPCRDCDAILPNKTELYKHRQDEHCDDSMQMITQGDGRITSCKHCGHNLHNAFALEKHIKEVHGNPDKKQQYECDQHARAHTAHTGERAYPCDVCGVAFRRATAMRNHRLIHSGVRPWTCTRCPKRFRIKSDLKTHVKLKHPAHLAVIEIEGTSCTPEEILNLLAINNIDQDKVIDINMMSFIKDSVNIIPNSVRALSLLGDVPKTEITTNQKSISDKNDILQPYRRGRGIAKPNTGNITNYQIDDNNLSNINVQLLLQDGGLVNNNEIVQLQIHDQIL